MLPSLSNRVGWLVTSAFALPLVGVMFLGPEPRANGQVPPPRPPIPRPPAFQPPPPLPRPPMPAQPGTPNPNIPRFEQVWTCSGCKAELGRGPFKPNLESCPKCKVRFGNTMAGMMANAQDRMNGVGGNPAQPGGIPGQPTGNGGQPGGIPGQPGGVPAQPGGIPAQPGQPGGVPMQPPAMPAQPNVPTMPMPQA